ncbi:unnamed protein product [Cyprideis torosa]|uniref:Uncharacterized protein n=1 Tax=Cyprideis torosa TaxID=163714 RepID=A0A7R8ZIY8_9CRUS|nr:unnamed protein product [Cyprideis torosa]CAG0887379.1 unnamed protein product [Cyprideis torosa]
MCAPEIKAKESETLHFGPKLQEKTGLLAQQLTVIVSKGTTAQPKKAEALIKQLRERPTSISKEDVDLIKHILEHSTTETSQAEKTLNEIKKEFADYIEDRKALEDLKKADPKTTIRESIGSKILSKKLNKMITQLEKTQAVIKMQAAIEEAEKVGGMKDHAIQQERETYESGALMIKGLIHELQKISANVTEEKAKVIESILEELDEDHDGFLSKEFLWKVTDLLKDSDLSISKEQIKEVVEILRKEQELRKDGTPSGEGK